MCSTNLNWSNAISVRETVVYQPLQSAPDSKTQFKQDAKITALCGRWQKLKNSIEDASVERFRQNAATGKEGFESVLQMCSLAFGEQREEARRQQQHQQEQAL